MIKETIPLFKVFMSPEAGEQVQKVLYSGYIAQGPKVEEFEKALGQFLRTSHILALNSGTSALQLACTLAGVGPGKYVISTPMTCTATNTAIRAVGGDILWADIDVNTGNISPQSVEQVLKDNTDKEIVAAMGVDWGGMPCNWAWLRQLADEYDLKLIRDAAHAFGTRYYDHHAYFADYHCYSFQAIKHLTAVDGGALVCLNGDDYKRGKLLRWFGIDRDGPRTDFRCEADVVEAGFKYHMNDVNATIGLANLRWAPNIIAQHRTNAEGFTSAFSPWLPRLGAKMSLPVEWNNHRSAYWLYTLLVEDRPKFMEYMLGRGITVSQVHARNDHHTMFQAYRRELPGVDYFSAHQVNIPVGWWLTNEEYDHIVSSVINYIRGDV